MNTDRIISFKPMIGGMDIAASRDILWPCGVYNIFIPHRGFNRLNIFEETILGLTAIGIKETAKLADESCMENDLVSFIQNRLSLLGFLDSRKEITDRGKAVLAQKESDAERDYVAATAFMDLTNGKMLPFVMIGALEYKTLVKNDGKRAEFKYKPTDEWSVTAQIIRGNEKWLPPKENEIIGAIRKFRERYDKYAAFSENTASPPNIPRNSIIISPLFAPVYLHCKAFIQKSNPDAIVVTDGFGFGFSGSFAYHLENYDNGSIVTAVKEKAVVDFIVLKDGTKKPAKKRIHLIAQLIIKAKDIFKETQKYVGQGDSADRTAAKEYQYALTETYEALERTFAQIVFDEGDIQYAGNYAGNFTDSKEILKGCAKKIGLMVNKRNEFMLKPKYGKLRLMDEDSIDMHSVLALAITGASYSGHHPFNKLAEEYPEILSILSDFNIIRKPAMHSGSEIRNLRERLEYYLEKSKKIITLLLPDIAKQFDSYSEKSDSPDIEKINQDRLKARNKLDRYFGVAAMCDMNPELREQLIPISILDENAGNGDFPFKSGINDLAAALQRMYHEVILTADIFQRKNNSPSEIKSIAFEKAVRAGFTKTIQDIPPILDVSPEKLMYVLQGSSYSLQANFIVLLYLCGDETLRVLCKECPDLIKFTAELADLRGHGITDFSGETNMPEKFKVLKDKAYKAIKTLMEV